jgi:hypothetical protein
VRQSGHVGVLRLTRPVDDASHHGYPQFLDARVRRAPVRHLLLQVLLDVLGHLLEEGRGGAPAAGTGGDLRGKVAQA